STISSPNGSITSAASRSTRRRRPIATRGGTPRPRRTKRTSTVSSFSLSRRYDSGRLFPFHYSRLGCLEVPGEAHRHHVTRKIVEVDIGMPAIVEIFHA